MIAGRLRWGRSRGEDAGQDRARRVRLRGRHAAPHRGRVASGAPRCTWWPASAATRRRSSAAGSSRSTRTQAEFVRRLRLENHTLKRALTDPRLFSGIGNAYSDEILHRARLSPLRLTSRLARGGGRAAPRRPPGRCCRNGPSGCGRRPATGFPEKVTAFREGMAVHGRFRQPCPVCGTPIQRIRYAENETNYCPVCQTEGRLLADRGLSRLLRAGLAPEPGGAGGAAQVVSRGRVGARLPGIALGAQMRPYL